MLVIVKRRRTKSIRTGRLSERGRTRTDDKGDLTYSKQTCALRDISIPFVTSGVIIASVEGSSEGEIGGGVVLEVSYRESGFAQYRDAHPETRLRVRD